MNMAALDLFEHFHPAHAQPHPQSDLLINSIKPCQTLTCSYDNTFEGFHIVGFSHQCVLGMLQGLNWWKHHHGNPEKLVWQLWLHWKFERLVKITKWEYQLWYYVKGLLSWFTVIVLFGCMLMGSCNRMIADWWIHHGLPNDRQARNPLLVDPLLRLTSYKHGFFVVLEITSSSIAIKHALMTCPSLLISHLFDADGAWLR